MILIDKYAYDSKLARISPKAKLIYTMFPLLLCISLNSFVVSAATILVMAVTTVGVGKIKLSAYFKLLFIPFGFLMVGTITILINRFDLNHVYLLGVRIGKYVYGIDRVTLTNSLKLVLNALGGVSCMYCLSLSTPMSDLFQVLRQTKLPDVIVTLMELIYRYIFVLLDEIGRMNVAKNSRLGNCNFRTSLKSTSELISMLFIRAYNRSDRVYAALESRGYNGQFVTLDDEYLNGKKMYMLSILLCLLLLSAGLAERLLL